MRDAGGAGPRGDQRRHRRPQRGDLGDLLPLPRASQSQLTAIEDGAELLAEADELTGKGSEKKVEQAMEDVALALAGAYGMDVPEEDAKP